LDRLTEVGLVRRRPDPSDRRGTLVRLTPKGKAVIDAAMEIHLANQDRLLRSLSAADRRALERALRRLLAGMEAHSLTGIHDRSPNFHHELGR
jgi:DNA-binding MarR family transcriptional regulator